jgi:hypothetical protein
MHVEGHRGVKGLRAAEGYGLGRHAAPDAAQCLVFALCEVFELHLEAVPHAFFIMPQASYDLARELMEPPLAQRAPLHACLHLLLRPSPTSSSFPV